MPQISDKREKLVQAARTLIHQNGYRQTSIADIAEASGVPLGNIYYYFKTKDDLVSAAIHQRRDLNLQWFATLELLPSPKARLTQFLLDVRESADIVTEHGCPVGSLCQELNKSPSAISSEINSVLQDQIDWSAKQFGLMGRTDGAEMSRQLACRLQGSMLVAHALNDTSIISTELDRLQAWVDNL